jgi:hypothetical protein
MATSKIAALRTPLKFALLCADSATFLFSLSATSYAVPARLDLVARFPAGNAHIAFCR